MQLCDDSFEEHVLPYGPEQTGLHLHGLNACAGRFETAPQDVVDAFARAWGLIVTRSTVLESVGAVRAFTEDVGRTGAWDGAALEGFVVRTRVSAPFADTKRGKGSGQGRGGRGEVLYPAGASFFFKVKFDEPYLMYRDWREATKALLSKGPSAGNVPKGKMRRAETKLYVDWVCAEIRRDREPFRDFNKGKGIIATRERFLRWLESEEGQKARNGAEEKRKQVAAPVGGKTIIMPIAIPGCGECSARSLTAPAVVDADARCRQDDGRGRSVPPFRVRARAERRHPAEEGGPGVPQERRQRAEDPRRRHRRQVRLPPLPPRSLSLFPGVGHAHD